jgi:hypothetical protein
VQGRFVQVEGVNGRVEEPVFFEKEQFFRRLCQSYWELVYFETSGGGVKPNVFGCSFSKKNLFYSKKKNLFI